MEVPCNEACPLSVSEGYKFRTVFRVFLIFCNKADHDISRKLRKLNV